MKYDKTNQLILVKCGGKEGEEEWVGVKEMTVEGHGLMGAAEFANGFILSRLGRNKDAVVGFRSLVGEGELKESPF